MVRDGRVTLYDLRRSVAVVSHWPPRPDDILMRRLSGLASEVSETIGTLPGGISSLVMEYWQGVTQDYLSPHTQFVLSMDMYKCNHVWPCANNETFDRPCLWMRWSQHWVHELHICDSQSYHFMHRFPPTWQAWVDQRAPAWGSAPRAPVHEALRHAPWGMFDSFWDGDDFLKMAECHPTLGPIPFQQDGPSFKAEHRCHDAWYNRDVALTQHEYLRLGRCQVDGSTWTTAAPGVNTFTWLPPFATSRAGRSVHLPRHIRNAEPSTRHIPFFSSIRCVLFAHPCLAHN